jgi:3-phenylpropionate/trans-cinnamate dioxygenase ferredoxin reductase subunit
MTAAGTVIIVGGGQAGFQAASSLRDEGFAGRILLLGDEPHLPYPRPPLSKASLESAAQGPALSLRPQKFFDDKMVEVRPKERVEAIDRANGFVGLQSGEAIAYDHLILATGTRNRLLSISGADLDGIAYLRTLADAEALRARLEQCKNLVVIGAGFIGLEVAAVARKRGIKTTVLDIAPRAMGRAVSSRMSDYFHDLHTRNGATLRMNVGIASICGDKGRVTGIEFGNGEQLAADLVLVGIGVVPNVELAAAAGLSVNNGIVVDEFMTTSDPNISAIGDCAAFPFGAAGNLVRLESVQNATDQGRAVAAKLAGRPVRYASVPWFWSDQGDVKLQIVGLTVGHDEVLVSGEPEAGCFSAFCFKQGELVGIESVNRPADHMAGRRLLKHEMRLSPEQVVAMNFDVKAMEIYARAAVMEACP